LGCNTFLFSNTLNQNSFYPKESDSDSTTWELWIVKKRNGKTKKVLIPGQKISIWSKSKRQKARGILSNITQDSIQVDTQIYALEDIQAMSPVKHYREYKIGFTTFSMAGYLWALFVIILMIASQFEFLILFMLMALGGILAGIIGMLFPRKFNSSRFEFIIRAPD